MLALTVGLLGGLALASLAGARRTASTFAAYQRDVRLSDVAVNTNVPDLNRVAAIARLPGVRTSATWVGLNAFPVLHGHVVKDFRYTGVLGSLDGRFFTQDRATVVEGRLPRLDDAGEVALSSKVAARFGRGVGDNVTYQFDDSDFRPLGRTTYRVVGIVRLPPVIVDENDIIEGAVLPPAATRVRLGSLQYAWQGIRLVDGTSGISRFQRQLKSNPAVNTLAPVTQRYDDTRAQAQRSIRPQAVALALFGIGAALAALALGAFGVVRAIKRWSSERLALRSVGLTRHQLALISGLDAAIAVAFGILLACLVATALSPLWPLGQLREIAPDTGLRLDLTVMLGAGGLLALTLLAVGTFSAWRTACDTSDRGRRTRPSVLVERGRQLGVPLSGLLGAHFALDPSESASSVPPRVTLVAGTAAILAVVTALVFGTSLRGLVDNPVRYGWAWDRMMIAEAGYGNLEPATVERVIKRGHAVSRWSLLAFNNVTIDGSSIPTLGLDRRAGHIQPPVLTGRTVTSRGEIALGKTTLEQLGRHVGDRVSVASGAHHAEVEIVGTAAFASIGRGGADHTSLGRGALMTFDALAELVAPGVSCGTSDDALCPQAVVFDLAPRADGDEVVARLAAADPDGTPGGTYEQPLTRAADIRNYDEMGAYPIAFSTVLAIAAVVAFVVTLFSVPRARRRDLAVLKTIGLARSQVRSALIAQALLTVLIALAVGVPLGIIAGRATWTRFAENIGVIPRPTIPLLTIVVIGTGAALLSSLLSLIPSTIAGRTPAARALRAE